MTFIISYIYSLPAVFFRDGAAKVTKVLIDEYIILANFINPYAELLLWIYKLTYTFSCLPGLTLDIMYRDNL